MQASCTFRVSRIVAICVLLVATELAVSRSNGQTVGSAPDMPAPAAPQQDATPLPPVDASPLAPAPQLAAVTADSTSNADSPAGDRQRERCTAARAGPELQPALGLHSRAFGIPIRSDL